VSSSAQTSLSQYYVVRVEMTRQFITGNEAIAYGALAAGCNFYAGYPITPSSEIMHIMAVELPKRGGVFVQVEDEIAAINVLVGASWAGSRAMTATSGPGFSLMQEGIGYAIMTETPLVVVDVMRAGPATGQATKPAQGDLMQARWGRHGDQALPVLAPSSPQECYDLVIRAFTIAEKLRTPVVVLSDEFIGHGREVVELHKDVQVPSRRKPKSPKEPPFYSEDPRVPPPMPSLGEGFNVLVTGSTHDGYGYRDTRSFETHYRLVKRIWNKIWLNIDSIFEYEAVGVDDAIIGFVAYGSTARSAAKAVSILREEGIRAGYVKLKTLWPLDTKPIEALAERVEAIIVPELSLGQLVFDVERAVKDYTKIHRFNKVGGGEPIYPRELVELAKKVLGR